MNFHSNENLKSKKDYELLCHEWEVYLEILIYLLAVSEGNAKLSLCLIKHHAKKTYWKVKAQRHASTLALDGGNQQDLRRTPNYMKINLCTF
jgi:hypothetical protein